MLLLIYIPPIFAGIIGRRYLGRLANFILMMVVFQFDMAILLGGSSPLAFIFTPYTVICIIPAVVGMIGGKYLSESKYIIAVGSRYFHLGNIVNAIVIIAVFWPGGVLWAYESRGQFMPLSFLTGIFVSAGFLFPPLVFIIVAIVAYRLRLRWYVTEEAGTYSIRDHMNHSGH